MERLYIKLDEILILDRCRKDMGDIDKLIESIKSIGMINPIVVCKNRDRKTNKQYKYILLSGQRRIEATRAIGNKAIFADVRACDDYATMIRFETSENYSEHYSDDEKRNVNTHISALKSQWDNMEIEPIILSAMNPMRLTEPAVTESSGKTDIIAKSDIQVNVSKDDTGVDSEIVKKQQEEIESLKKQLKEVKDKMASDRRSFDREIQKLIDENVELQIKVGNI